MITLSTTKFVQSHGKEPEYVGLVKIQMPDIVKDSIHIENSPIHFYATGAEDAEAKIASYTEAWFSYYHVSINIDAEVEVLP